MQQNGINQVINISWTPLFSILRSFKDILKSSIEHNYRSWCLVCNHSSGSFEAHACSDPHIWRTSTGRTVPMKLAWPSPPDLSAPLSTSPSGQPPWPWALGSRGGLPGGLSALLGETTWRTGWKVTYRRSSWIVGQNKLMHFLPQVLLLACMIMYINYIYVCVFSMHCRCRSSAFVLQPESNLLHLQYKKQRRRVPLFNSKTNIIGLWSTTNQFTNAVELATYSLSRKIVYSDGAITLQTLLVWRVLCTKPRRPYPSLMLQWSSQEWIVAHILTKTYLDLPTICT